MASEKAEEIASLARSLVGKSCYVWGARGQNMTDMPNAYDWVLRQETADSQYNKQQNAFRVMHMYDRLVGRGINPVLAFDCSGFVYYVYNKCNVISVRRNAESYFKRCEEITDVSSLKTGDLVFRHNGAKISHVGIYVGGKMVVHCKGRDVGVVEEKLSAYPWNKYGRVDGVYDRREYDTMDGKAYVKTLGNINLRSVPGATDKTTIVATVTKGLRLAYVETDSKTGWYKVLFKGHPLYITNNQRYTRLVHPNEGE